jgi:hypothetical protein
MLHFLLTKYVEEVPRLFLLWPGVLPTVRTIRHRFQWLLNTPCRVGQFVENRFFSVN